MCVCVRMVCRDVCVYNLCLAQGTLLVSTPLRTCVLLQVIRTSSDSPPQYNATMNCIFAAQKDVSVKLRTRWKFCCEPRYSHVTSICYLMCVSPTYIIICLHIHNFMYIYCICLHINWWCTNMPIVWMKVCGSNHLLSHFHVQWFAVIQTHNWLQTTYVLS